MRYSYNGMRKLPVAFVCGCKYHNSRFFRPVKTVWWLSLRYMHRRCCGLHYLGTGHLLAQQPTGISAIDVQELCGSDLRCVRLLSSSGSYRRWLAGRRIRKSHRPSSRFQTPSSYPIVCRSTSHLRHRPTFQYKGCWEHWRGVINGKCCLETLRFLWPVSSSRTSCHHVGYNNCR